MKQYIEFSVKDQKFAMDISEVERIIEFQQPKEIPESLESLLGVIRYNDRVLPIIDLGKRFYNINSTEDLNTKIIVASWNERQLGLMVDSILGIEELADKQYRESGKDTQVPNKYILGFITVEEDITMVLDTQEIFDLEQEELISEAIDNVVDEFA